jgi:hypothetical protein
MDILEKVEAIKNRACTREHPSWMLKFDCQECYDKENELRRAMSDAYPAIAAELRAARKVCEAAEELIFAMPNWRHTMASLIFRTEEWRKTRGEK